MSASEKLKELHPLLTGPPARKFRDEAWDEIIAVIYAAEQTAACVPGLHNNSLRIFLNLQKDALDALDEALQ